MSDSRPAGDAAVAANAAAGKSQAGGAGTLPVSAVAKDEVALKKRRASEDPAEAAQKRCVATLLRLHCKLLGHAGSGHVVGMIHSWSCHHLQYDVISWERCEPVSLHVKQHFFNGVPRFKRCMPASTKECGLHSAL